MYKSNIDKTDVFFDGDETITNVFAELILLKHRAAIECSIDNIRNFVGSISSDESDKLSKNEVIA